VSTDGALTHELLHYLLQEPCHAEYGVFQSSFTPFELTEPRSY
jgi:hypothetical protein